MNTIDIEKLNQLISRTDISSNDKVRWLTDFIDGRELQLIQDEFYSEEEVIAFGEFIFKHTLLAHSKGVKNLFEQFKNK